MAYYKGLYAAISCWHADSEFTMENSPVLQPMAGKTPIARMIDRLLSYELFEKILILVPRNSRYDAYFEYNSNRTPVVLMGDEILKLNARYDNTSYGIHNGQTGDVYAWYLKLLQQNEIKLLYADSVLRGWITRQSLIEGINFIQKNPQIEVTFAGLFGQEGRILSYESLKPRLAEDGRILSNQIFASGPEVKFERIFTQKFLNTSFNIFTSYTSFTLSYARRQNLTFLTDFFENCEKRDDDYQEDLIEYCKKNYEYFFSKVPHIIWQKLVEDDQIADSATLRDCFEKFSATGRLQVVFGDDFLEYPYQQELISLMQSYNLHYVIQLRADFDPSYQNLLIDHFDTVILKLNEVDLEYLKLTDPNVNAELAFKNLEQCSRMAHDSPKPQLGILCELPKCSQRSTRIVAYWARHYAYCKNGLHSIDGYYGGLSPQVDFVRYVNHDHTVKNSDLVQPRGLVVDTKGCFPDGIKSCEVDLKEYCESYGFHREPEL